MFHIIAALYVPGEPRSCEGFVDALGVAWTHYMNANHNQETGVVIADDNGTVIEVVKSKVHPLDAR